MAFEMFSLFPQNICLTAWHCLRAEYFFTPPATLGGAKGTVFCSRSPGSPWKRRLSSPLSSGLVAASGREQMLLTQCGFLNPDKTPIVAAHKRGIHNSSKQVICTRVKNINKFWEQLYFFLQIQWKLFVLESSYPNDVLSQLHLAAIFVTSGSNRIHIVLNAC